MAMSSMVDRTEIPGEFLEVLKALADQNRLKIVGLLAQRPYSVEELAANLGLGASTVSHHLSRLSRAGLTSARAEGYNNVYSLEVDALHGIARRMLSREELTTLAKDVDLDSFDRKVLATFTEPDGSIRAFPVQEKKMRVLLRHVLDAFEPGRRYAEKEVNEILARFNPDTARLRRSLVMFGMMQREGGGGAYWRTPPEEA
jgi:predicted transcriptional regulator